MRYSGITYRYLITHWPFFNCPIIFDSEGSLDSSRFFHDINDFFHDWNKGWDEEGYINYLLTHLPFKDVEWLL